MTLPKGSYECEPRKHPLSQACLEAGRSVADAQPELMHSAMLCRACPPRKNMTKAGVGSRNEVAPTMCNAPPSARTASVSWPQFWDPQNHSFGAGLLGGRLLRTRIVKHVMKRASRPGTTYCTAGAQQALNDSWAALNDSWAAQNASRAPQNDSLAVQNDAALYPKSPRGAPK